MKVKMVALDAVVENFAQQPDIVFQPNSFSHLYQVFLAHPRTEVRIVEQEVSEFGALLDQIYFGHSGGFALELLGRDSHDLAQDVSGIVERQGLIEIADE